MGEKTYNFQKLTPIKNVELKIYEDAFKYVFDNEEIKNIAISGPYSAGKSSLIETYKSVHPETKFLHISLAHFEKLDGSNSKSDGYTENTLEGKILNQLIHQIDSEKIPQTNFKIKREIPAGSIIKDTIIITLFLILIAYIAGFNIWVQFVSTLSQQWLKNLLAFTTDSISLLLSGILCAVLLSFAVYSVVKVQRNKNILKKVNFQGNEIEIFEQNNESYFDKYLNEVLYIFRNSDADVIVFEDMDRYNINGIFEKLREINTLVNNKSNGKKLIRFFYLLRDDIFVSKDRTKFFDFLIPVVPVIDASNSYDQFIQHFNQGNILSLFTEKFMQELSLYVDDMRILKNINNEFLIYHDRIQSTELNNDKLLAMVTYKNIFPRDFSDLQLGKGFVHTLFESKHGLLKQELQDIDLQILKIKEEIRLADNELLDSIDELDAAYLPFNYQINSIGGISIPANHTRLQLVKAMKRNPDSIRYYHPNYGTKDINMTNEFEKLLQNAEYVKRKQAIEDKSQERNKKLLEDLHKLEERKTVLQNSRLKDTIKKENIDAVFSVSFTNEIGKENKFEEIKSSQYFDLIKFLLRNGYIDETYSDYMTYFYENSLSREDKIFLRSITDQVPKGYTYSLKSPELVVSRLRAIDFSHEEVLNFELLCYLLKTRKSNTEYLHRFLSQLMETKNLDFIGKFFITRRETSLFLEELNHLWPNIWFYIHSGVYFGKELTKQYAIDTIYFSSDEDIKEMNQESLLTIFISNTDDFLQIDSPNITKLISGLILLDVKFESIDYDKSHKELFYEVYKNNMYKIKYELVTLMLKKIYNLAEGIEFKTQNYTLISLKPDEPLALYIRNNINEYMAVVLENCDNTMEDDEKAVLDILNNNDLDGTYKERYISFLNTEITDISEVIDKEQWTLLLEQDLVNYSADNILEYFFSSGKGLDNLLVQFINTNVGDLSFYYDTIDNKYGEKTASKFYKAIITCNQLFNEKYETILLSLDRVYNSFPHKGLSDEKIIILVKNYIIQMTNENLSFMRENYPEQLMLFIYQNIEKYANEVINEDNFDLNEALGVLDENVDEEYKIKLLRYTTDEISIKDKKYSDTLKMYILEHNLDKNDLKFLIKSYYSESSEVKELIARICEENIDEIINEEYLIPFQLLLKLISSEELNVETKKQLFVLCLPNMNEARAKECLRVLKMNDFLSLFNGKRPKFEINSVNKQILDIFKKMNWILRFEPDKNEPDYYRAFGRKTEEVKISV